MLQGTPMPKKIVFLSALFSSCLYLVPGSAGSGFTVPGFTAPDSTDADHVKLDRVKSVTTEQHKTPFDLHSNQHLEITFKRIPANQFNVSENGLRIQVNSSASFMLYPFSRSKNITGADFRWRSSRDHLATDRQTEESTAGDDALLRIGLLIAGAEASFENPLAPAWTRKVRQALPEPSNHLLYLIVGSRHQAGEQWLSPYSDKVTMIAVASQPYKDGWQQASYRFKTAKKVVGLWIMADGDNTRSRFTTELEQLILHVH